MPSQANIRQYLSTSPSLQGKRSLVVGGTSGIGLGIARRLYLQGSHVTVVGRSKDSGENAVKTIQDEAEKEGAKGVGKVDYDVVDMTLLKEARAFGERLSQKEQRLDHLIVSSGIMRVQGRVETVEGMDEKMAVHYYSRMELFHTLMPLLEKTAALPDSDVRVLNVLSSRIGQLPSDPEDLELKKTFSLKNCHDATTFYSDLAAESFSLNHPNITFLHAHPGAVATNLFRDLPSYIRVPANFLAPYLLTHPNDAGDAMAYSVLAPEFHHKQTGWALLNERAAAGQKLKGHTDDVREKVWKHLQAVRERIFGK
ncbi:hypothetical protein HDU97_007565 [Phlyctochytrium planicorne]|nr:hypothetical protein HDU97_007565 [Phlyctochytrium planicorne]